MTPLVSQNKFNYECSYYASSLKRKSDTKRVKWLKLLESGFIIRGDIELTQHKHSFSGQNLNFCRLVCKLKFNNFFDQLYVNIC